MSVQFTADTAEVLPRDWGSVVVVRDSADETLERYLMLQRKDEFSERDVEWRQDDVYIEVCGQGWSWYGHILSFVARSNKLMVRLDAEAAERMSDDGMIEVDLALPHDTREALRRALRQVFAGFSYFREEA